jgi:hypothetical protein
MTATAIFPDDWIPPGMYSFCSRCGGKDTCLHKSIPRDRPCWGDGCPWHNLSIPTHLKTPSDYDAHNKRLQTDPEYAAEMQAHDSVQDKEVGINFAFQQMSLREFENRTKYAHKKQEQGLPPRWWMQGDEQ